MVFSFRAPYYSSLRQRAAGTFASFSIWNELRLLFAAAHEIVIVQEKRSMAGLRHSRPTENRQPAR